MTFNFAPWALDGARTPAALARVSAYALGGNRGGVVKPRDLRVQPLAVPGPGLRITTGAAVILNRYQSTPDQSYVVSNPSTHTVPSGSMPPVTGGTAYYLVCVVVGDPEYNQAGHPFMSGDPIAPEVAADFEYVRVVVLPCGAGTTTFEELGKNYPGYALARLTIPGNTATITSGMITDVRQLTRSRQERALLPLDPPDGHAIQSTDWVDWPPDVYSTVRVPDWATHVTVVATATGVRNLGTAYGDLRVLFGGYAGPNTLYLMPNVDMLDEGTTTHVASIDMDCSALAGTVQTLRFSGRRAAGYAGYILTYPGTHFIFDVHFSEKPLT